MKKIHIRCVYTDESGKYTSENLYTEYDEQLTPFQMVQKVFDRFNQTLRSYEKARKLLMVRTKYKVNIITTEHDWEKTNLVTCEGGYDTYRCTCCGVTGKRYSLRDSITMDPKFKSNRYQNCDWKLK